MIQIEINSLINASMFLLIGISFLTIYSVCKFFHFTHAVIFVISSYYILIMTTYFHISLFVLIPIAVILTVTSGCVLNNFIYRSLRFRHVNPIIMLLTSLGIYIVLQNTISMIFGDDIKSIRTGIVKEGLNVFGARITPVQIAIIVTAIIVLILMMLFMKKTKIGKAMQAVASDARLANISGINSERVILWAFAIGSGLAGLAGILYAMDVDMTPTMGMPILMMGIVAMIVGGVGSIPGIALGALLLGFAKNFGAYYIGSQWQDAIAFVILLVFLIFRPQGFLGKKLRSSEV